MSSQTFVVSGMTCGHCAKSVTEELSELPGVSGVQVSVESGQVSVTSEQELTRDAVAAAITEAGYTIAGWPGAN
ncbi:heavy-metal-associated domain-containing protein [Saccharopolyspora sp. ASAGF58]|uniref:heavy-metal-associated domain-containing protein n=1 Tax=Saccharopolyspora TaxID=1835 RepID=UPI00143FE59E|nr:heavy-metal-associated domain-containing protein [Saccharopolyspora sp. ASAGF58]QIZ34982.1 heavy-metal-associated domain-containing protein [Saccharopolyspora sp. ASAGF58]